VLFQTCINSFLLNTKEDILKNVGNQTVDRPHRLPTMEVSGYQHSSEYLFS